MRGVLFESGAACLTDAVAYSCCSDNAISLAATHHAQTLGGQLNHNRLLCYFFLRFDDNFHGSLRAKVISAPNWPKSLRFSV